MERESTFQSVDKRNEVSHRLAELNSIPREFSSAGRASALQAEGQRFDPVNSHHSRKNRSRSVAVITSPCHGEDRGFDSRRDRFGV